MAVARARGSGLDASSVVQDTLLRVLRLREVPKTESQLEATAWRLMEWVILDRVRSERARDRREAQVGTPDPDVRVDPRLERLSEVLRELAAVDPRKVEVLTLSMACGLPMTRIAELLEVSVKTVQRDLEFGRAWVAARLDQAGADHSSA